MFKSHSIESGILDRTRLVSNILMLVLVAGNIFFSIQYMVGTQMQQNQKADSIGTNIQVANFLKLFVDVVLNTKAGQQISYNDRVKLEDTVRQINDADIIKQWDTFVASKDSKTAQDNAVSLMKILTDKLLLTN